MRDRFLQYLLFTFIIASCTKPSITIHSNPTMVFEGKASSLTLSFSSTHDWTVSSSDSWIKVSPSGGQRGEMSIKVSVLENDPNNGSRKGIVTITTEGVSEHISVEQQQLNIIESDSGFSIEPSGGYLGISVAHNVDLSVIISDNAKEWIKLIGTKAVVSNLFEFEIAPNRTTVNRSSVITFTGDGVSKEVLINQKGEYLDINVSSLDYDPKESYKTIVVSSSCSWAISSEHPWVQFFPNKGEKGLTEIKITVLENDEFDKRSCNVQIVNSEYAISKTIRISQRAFVWYVDENGIKQGKGITVDGRIWAPVNCGYDPTEAPRGKFYQWGRKHGQAAYTATVADIWQGENGAEDANTVYRYSKDDNNSGARFKNDWIVNGDNAFWNKGTESNPVKNEQYDPCPKGWRVPTMQELFSLTRHSFYRSGEYGTWFSGSKEYSDDLEERVFLPAAGHRKGFWECSLENSGQYGFYWSSTPNKYNDDCPEYLFFKSTTMGSSYYAPYRDNGQSVRCIHE